MATNILTSQQVTALRIARKLRLNIRLNAGTVRHDTAFHSIARRLWDEATQAGIDPRVVHGFLAALD